MFALLTKDVEFNWIKEFQNVFDCIKKKLMTTLILQGPKWDIPFHIHSNAYDKSL